MAMSYSHPLVLVTGLSAVGKTYLCHGLEDVPTTDVVGFGSLMRDEYRRVERDTDIPLSKLRLENRVEIQRMVFTEINKLNKDKAIIIDGHIIVEQGDTSLMVPGIPRLADDEQPTFNGVVIIIDNPETISARRAKNTKYDKFTKEPKKIRLIQEMQNHIAANYAIVNGSFLSVLDLSSSVTETDPHWDGPREVLCQTIGDIFKNLDYSH